MISLSVLIDFNIMIIIIIIIIIHRDMLVEGRVKASSDVKCLINLMSVVIDA